VKQFFKKPGFDAGFFVAMRRPSAAAATASARKSGLIFGKHNASIQKGEVPCDPSKARRLGLRMTQGSAKQSG